MRFAKDNITIYLNVKIEKNSIYNSPKLGHQLCHQPSFQNCMTFFLMWISKEDFFEEAKLFW